MPIRTVRELMAASPHTTEPVILDFTNRALSAAGTAIPVVGSPADPTPYPLTDSWLFGEIDVADWSVLHFGFEWGNVTAGIITIEGKVSATDLRWSSVYMFQDNSTANSTAGTTSTPTADSTHRYTADVSPYKVVRMRVTTAIPAAATTFLFGLRRAYYFLSSRHESNRKGNASAITSSTVTVSATAAGNAVDALTTLAGTFTGATPTAATAVNHVVRTAATTLYSISVCNPAATDTFLEVHNVSAAPSLTAAVAMSANVIWKGKITGTGIVEFGNKGMKLGNGCHILITGNDLHATAAGAIPVAPPANVTVHGNYIANA